MKRPIHIHKNLCLRLIPLLLIAVVALLFWRPWQTQRDEEERATMPDTQQDLIPLPDPQLEAETSIEQALSRRRSVREYGGRPLTLEEVGQLLWAAQGVTDERGYRTAPSAGALYPLELYLVAGDVVGLEAGVYRYSPQGHALALWQEGDPRDALTRAALQQTYISEAPASLVFSAVYARTEERYGARAERYVHMEVGHAAQNVYLQAESLDLGTVVIGAFDDAEVRQVIGTSAEETPLYIMPVGPKP